jgi:carbamoyltransferase
MARLHEPTATPLSDPSVLGINAYHGDASVALLQGGELLTAVEEERFRRVKHWAGFPRLALGACLEGNAVDPRAIQHFAVSRNPRAHIRRKALFALRHRPLGVLNERRKNMQRLSALPETLSDCLGLDSARVRRQLHWIEHHPAHLASAYYASPFETAAVCAIDGFGDFVSTSWGIGQGHRLDVTHRTFFPHSLGLLYLAVTQYLGFWKYGDEYKVMGLAPYGSPDYEPELRQLIRLEDNGRFRLNLDYFRHWSQGVSMTWDDGEPIIGPTFTPLLENLLGPARKTDEPVEPRHEAIAASLQAVFEDAAFHCLRALYAETRLPRLCLAGGSAMNSVFNGRIQQQTPFKEVFVQPAAGDSGTAIGAALYVAHHVLGQNSRFVMRHAYWGPAFGDSAIRLAIDGATDRIRQTGVDVRRFDDEKTLCSWTADRLAEGQIVGWFQGRMELGARALGNRSILADPRRPEMRDLINTKIKFREKFRPFAPSILEDALDDFFVDATPDPFMVRVHPVRPQKRRVIPAVTHVDGSGRIQTVNPETNRLFWDLIKAFEKRTGVPVLLNTSFNENEPIVNRPEEALDCFLRTRMDVLVLGRWILTKCTERG